MQIVRAAKPRDTIEEFLIRDVVDLTWEVLRLRRVKAALLRASLHTGVSEFLGSLGYHRNFGRDELTEKWAGGDKGTRQEVDSLLTKAGLTIDEATALTLDSKRRSSSIGCARNEVR